MSKIKLALVFTFGVLFFACGNKTDIDFSIVPVKGTNEEYQYIDLSQKGKIVINPQFSEAHIFRDGLARVKTSGKDGKWGYIDKKGKFLKNPIYSFTQDFSEGVAWVQIENQSPMLIGKNGETLLQIDSLIEATPFSNGIAGIIVYSKGEELQMFIDKKGETVATVTKEQTASLFINDDRYAVQNSETKKIGYKNKKGETVINEQFDEAYMFFEGTTVVRSGNKWGAIDKQGNFIINSQYDTLFNDHGGLFIARVGKKYGWVNKKGEIVINPQFDNIGGGFYRNKLAPVQMGSKFGYIDKTGQIVINPQFDAALPFNGDYAMVMNSDGKIGFIDKKGNFIVAPLYEGSLKDALEYAFATTQNAFNLTFVYESLKTIPMRNKSVYWKLNFLNYEILKEKKVAWKMASIEEQKGFTDPRDGKKYKAVKIGEQIWMAENMNYNANGSKCYENNPENCEKYGRLYNWNTALEVCPSGWHLPTNEEWNKLLSFVDGTSGTDIPYRSETAGKHLKAKSGWNENGSGEDTYGFAALPGGQGYSNGDFIAYGHNGLLWSASKYDYNSKEAYIQIILGNQDGTLNLSLNKNELLSVRCLLDVRQ